MNEKTLGQELVEAVAEALDHPTTGRVVRPKFDITGLRKKLGLTQKEFAERYHFNLQTLRNWEQEKRHPDSTGIAYLMCISSKPEMIQKILNKETHC